MNEWKQPSILIRNKEEITACIMLLDTSKKESDSDPLIYSYKTNDTASSFLALKGIILASVTLSNSIWSEDYRVLLIEYNGCKYKIYSRYYLKSTIISVIFPSIIPDNILYYCNNEFIDFINIFFDCIKDTKPHIETLNKISETIIYNTINYIINKDKESFLGSPLGNIPIVTSTYTYNEKLPNFIIKFPIKDLIKSELIEVTNTLTTDRSMLQDTLTFLEPPFYLKGYTLLYKGYTLCSTLSNSESCQIMRLVMLHELHIRTNSSSEVLVCEFINESEKINPSNWNSISLNFDETQELDKKKYIATILAQRDFVLVILLDILGKNNASFDPFYHKRAEDLVIGLLKKAFHENLEEELKTNSANMHEINEKSNYVQNTEKSIKSIKVTTNLLNSRIKGFTDSETKVNIIHFSYYDDTECVVNTTDAFVTSDIYAEIYKEVFHKYAKIQSNINKLKNKSKYEKIRSINSVDSLKEIYSLDIKSDGNIKRKILRDKYFKKGLKLNEYCIKLNVENYIPIWVCCKIYEHLSLRDDDTNLEEFFNFKIIFIAYESHIPVDMENFCQDLIINEMFI
jgi:hypothetical protein